MSSVIFYVFALFSFVKLASAACSDLAKTASFNDVCYETITCTQTPKTITGSDCAGGAISTVVPTYSCSPNPVSTPMFTQSCQFDILGSGSNKCSASPSDYAVGTVSRVGLVYSSGCLINTPYTDYQRISFRAGSVNGVLQTTTTSVETNDSTNVTNSASKQFGTTTAITVGVIVAVFMCAAIA
ncbi:hypothetical protein HK096_002754, partial [Nowakowskiella sp. JEL0078]